jgi:hypothetical protein
MPDPATDTDPRSWAYDSDAYCYGREDGAREAAVRLAGPMPTVWRAKLLPDGDGYCFLFDGEDGATGRVDVVLGEVIAIDPLSTEGLAELDATLAMLGWLRALLRGCETIPAGPAQVAEARALLAKATGIPAGPAEVAEARALLTKSTGLGGGA